MPPGQVGPQVGPIVPFDSKRYWLNAVESVPFGHYSISDWEEPRTEEEHAFQLQMLAGTSLREREELKRIDDAPMARLREIQKRQREEKASTITAATVPNIPGLTFREKRPRGMLLSMEELRSLRQ